LPTFLWIGQIMVSFRGKTHYVGFDPRRVKKKTPPEGDVGDSEDPQI